MSEEDIYVIRLRNLCLKGLPDNCAQLLAGVDDSKVMLVAQHFLRWVSLAVDIYEDGDDDRSERMLVLEAGIHTLEFLRNIEKITDDMKDTLDTLKSIQALEKEFSIFITSRDYSNIDTSDEILSAYLKKNGFSFPRLINMKGEKVQRLGILFGLSRVQLQNRIMFQYILHQPNSLNSTTMTTCNEWLWPMRQHTVEQST